MKLVELMVRCLFPPRRSECVVRDMEPHALLVRINPHIVEDALLETVALLPYRDPLVRACIAEAKYHNNTKAQRALGEVLAQHVTDVVREADEFESQPFVLIPIPLSETRMRKRGYNQTECIVGAALSCLGITHTPSSLLSRVRETSPQTLLPRASRLSNMEGAFAALPIDSHHTYILIDDVVTTGATFAAAQKALLQAGASSVICIALAH